MFQNVGIQTSNQVSFVQSNSHKYNLFLLTGDVVKPFLQLLVVQTFRPDRLLAMGHIFVATIMGEDFQQEAEQDPNLSVVVEEEVNDNVCHTGYTVYIIV